MTDRNDELLTLYKYRSLRNQQGRDAAEDIVLRNQMYWQSPVRFNDPFDCDPYWVFGTTPRDRRDFIRRVVAEQMMGIPRHERRQKRREMESRPIVHYEREARSAFQEWMGESAVTCFSRVNDSLLMWGHYADAHEGICLVFQEMLRPTFVAFDVNYQTERPVADITRLAGSEMFERAVLTKAAEWEYERELRMIDYRVPPGLRAFPPEALIGVIYGARMSQEDRRFMDDLLSRREEPELARFSATVSDREFRVLVSRSD